MVGKTPVVARDIAGQIGDDLRDHVARALDHHPVAGAHAQPFDLIGIVQRRIGHGDAAHPHRLQPRDRGQLAGPPDLDVDGVQRGFGLLRRKFMRERPAWCAPDKAQPRLPVEPVDLVDDTVDVERQIGAHPLDVAINVQRRLGRRRNGEQVRHRKAPAAQRIDHLCLGRPRHGGGFAPAMRQETQRARRGNARILLPQRSGGGVARIGELARAFGRLRLGQQARVQRQEIGLGHVNLAAHLEQLGRVIGQLARNIGDGQRVGGDILAQLPVAPRRGEHQPTALVTQRTGQAIDLRFGGQHHRFGIVERQEPPHPRDEIGDIFIGKGVVQAQHRPRMRHLGQMTGRCRTDQFRRRIGPDQMRESGLDRRIAPHQRVVIGIADLGRIVGVIEAIVPCDLARQLVELRGGVGVGGGQGVHAASLALGFARCNARQRASPILSRRWPAHRDRRVERGAATMLDPAHRGGVFGV